MILRDSVSEIFSSTFNMTHFDVRFPKWEARVHFHFHASSSHRLTNQFLFCPHRIDHITLHTFHFEPMPSVYLIIRCHCSSSSKITFPFTVVVTSTITKADTVRVQNKEKKKLIRIQNWPHASRCQHRMFAHLFCFFFFLSSSLLQLHLIWR